MNLTDAPGTIVKEITIKGSAERIFEALTNPDQRIKWWGAEGRFQATQMESDLRPGGKWVMRGIGIGGKPFTCSARIGPSSVRTYSSSPGFLIGTRGRPRVSCASTWKKRTASRHCV